MPFLYFLCICSSIFPVSRHTLSTPFPRISLPHFYLISFFLSIQFAIRPPSILKHRTRLTNFPPIKSSYYGFILYFRNSSCHNRHNAPYKGKRERLLLTVGIRCFHRCSDESFPSLFSVSESTIFFHGNSCSVCVCSGLRTTPSL